MHPSTDRRSLRALAPLLCLGAGLLASARPVAAQSHYWSDHFGNESILLSGAVIGSVTDGGAVFYNPARLVHQEDPVLLAGAKAYEWTKTRVTDGLGPGEDLKTSGFRGVPGFAVGSFAIPGLEGHQFAYGILTRHRGRVGFAVREERTDVVPDLPGNDLFVGFTDFDTEYRDDWMGVSWAHGLAEDLSIGASLFYFDREFRRGFVADFRAVDDLGNAATRQIERDYEAKDQGLVAKLGLAWRRGRLSAGLSVTLPYWAVAGKGTVRFDDFTVGIPDSTGTVANDLVSLQQNGLPLDWRTPWSVGAGVGWTTGPWQFHAAGEYFAGVPRHVLLRTDPGGDQISVGMPVDYAVMDERKAVLNGGIGVRWAGSDRIALFGSVASNVSAAPDSLVEFSRLDTLVSHTSLETDYVLVGGGVSIRSPWADFTLGATWQGGKDAVPTAVVLPNGRPPGGESEAVVHLTQWRFLAGVSIPMLDELLGGVLGR